ncbi:hypothetical protein RJ639_028695 [Escallonia herrerae]|uniref:CCR4-NOT transcription complex subunit 9 n=1 Tax=Escallonia herrerae TaxID=1293975 RepID=A0AA88X5S5_9ASTE|nr:hypothetical protein RJ639_028695 [Escallonia herrerae]
MEIPPEPQSVGSTEVGPSSSRGAAAYLRLATVEQLIILLREPRYREEVIVLLDKFRIPCLFSVVLSKFLASQSKLLLDKSLSKWKESCPKGKERNYIYNHSGACSANLWTAAHIVSSQGKPEITAKIPIYLYPFLKMKEVETPYAFLKLASLGVIGGLLKVDDQNSPQVVHFLLETELLPLCLNCMDLGNELTQTVRPTYLLQLLELLFSNPFLAFIVVAAFILSKILIQEEGLHYCCDYAERCYTVGRLLAGIIEKASKPKARQLKHVINCLLRMSDAPRACDALRRCFPAKLSDSSFINVLNQEDPSTMALLQQLIYKLTAVTMVSVDANWGGTWEL